MVTFPEALRRLLEIVAPAPVEHRSLATAAGCVLRQKVVADRAFPPFDRVMMDGFALRFADWKSGTRHFTIAGRAPAGVAVVQLPSAAGACIEVMTGAPCPAGADAIVPVEEVVRSGEGTVEFRFDAEVIASRYLHRAGSDAATGQVLMEEGTLLGSREIGVAASCGYADLEVSTPPEIAVIATGDELVSVASKPEPHQIRQSNAHSLAAALRRSGLIVHEGVLVDEESITEPELASLLNQSRWIVLTGAVSKGSRDFLPNMLTRLGWKNLFHGVAHRPGFPAGCWQRPDGRMIFGLPGNPVSALTCLHVFVMPALEKSLGRTMVAKRHVKVEEPPWLDQSHRHLPVKLLPDGSAEPAPVGNSGDFIGLLASDGFVTLPPRGTSNNGTFPFTPWL